ncbi:Ig-like domain-containing protein [Amphibiibacter pelophylacis]|uniref:Ig-like domain-containing protein n=1 Tax=Amphibiibacter pelophylacis TaxID=1799477 RepID=A0ACC6P4E1_9BURK
MKWQGKPLILAALASAVLAACGGGGGSAGTSLYGSGSGAGTTTDTSGQAAQQAAAAKVASLQIQPFKGSSRNGLTGAIYESADSFTVSNKVVMQITAVDANGNVVSGAPITVKTGGGAVINSGVLTGTTDTSNVTKYTLTQSTVTDGNGAFVAVVSPGQDMSNHSVTLSAEVTYNTTVAAPAQTLMFSGTSISAPVLSPSSLSVGGKGNTATYTLVNGVGDPISGQTVSFTVNGGDAQTATTSGTGKAAFTFDSPMTAGAVIISASAMGETSSQTLTLSQADAATASAASFGSAYLSPGSTSVSANQTSSDSNEVPITARLLTPGNQPLVGALVGFRVDPASNYSGGNFYSGSNLLVAPSATNGNGEVSASFRPGANTTATNGLNLQACYWFTGQSTTSCIPGQIANVSQKLTVVGPPVSLSIARADALTPSTDGTTYTKVFKVQVTDAQGVLKSGAVVTPGIQFNLFGKGYMDRGEKDTQWKTVELQWCLPKDSNGDNILQSTEDFDGSGQIAPRRSDVAVIPGRATTDSTGTVTFTVQYPKSVSRWVQFDFTASTSVAGTESVARLDAGAGLLLSELKKEESPAFQLSPYGDDGFIRDAAGTATGTAYPANCFFVSQPPY